MAPPWRASPAGATIPLMSSQPSLLTARLRLRPFTLEDASDVQRLAGDRAVADTTLSVPHPYPDGAAEEWIETHAAGFAAGRQANFAITLREGGLLVGAIGLVIDAGFGRAELGYWMGRPYWGQGYATEAAGEVVRYGLEELRLERIFATAMARNPASIRVLEKVGMMREGSLRGHVIKWGRREDLAVLGLLAEDPHAP
jgi:[ribosomal protein S5]-alanine N-acetyltransferase